MNTEQQSAIPNPQSPIGESAIKGFIQAGGRSSRMKRDKAWLEIDGVPMIEWAVAAVKPAAGRLGIIVNAANPQIEQYERLAESCDARLIFDLHEHLGPLGGIHTALAHCGAGESALILACDLPFITTEFLSFLCDVHQTQNPQSESVPRAVASGSPSMCGLRKRRSLPLAVLTRKSITVPLDQSDRLQPLAAIYDQSLEATVEQMLAANELRVGLLYSRVSTRQVGFFEFAHLRDAERFFINVNTPEEYRGALRRIS
jgi:molybdopterin-guanine dinucleotide biosynthesis protein A